MRKAITGLLLFAVFSSVGIAKADTDTGLTPEARAFKMGLKKGISVGIKFTKNLIKQELVDYWDIADTVFNYKYLFLSGEVPPPLVVDMTTVKRNKNGIAVVERKLNVLPPAYFPVSRIQALKSTLGTSDVVVPKGYITYVDATPLPLDTVGYYYFLAETDGSNPIFVPSKNMLIFGSFVRKADAEGLKEKLEKIGIDNVKVAKLSEDLRIKAVNPNKRLAQELKELAERMLQKEKAVYGTSAYSFKRGLTGVIYYLQKALAAVDTIDSRRYPDFETVRLRADINKIIIELNKYLSERQPYKGILPEPSYKDIKDVVEIETETTGKTDTKAVATKSENKDRDKLETIISNIEKLKQLVGEGAEK